MHTPQSILGPIIVVVMSAAACSRADTDEQARRVAHGVRTMASRAGDRLADSWLTTKIQTQYGADHDIKAMNIIVSTRDGVVTLKGQVDGENAREQAVNVARYTDGVRKVEDRLTVGQAASTDDAPADAVDEGGGIRDRSSGSVATTGTMPGGTAIVPMDDMSVTSRIQARYFLDAVLKGRRIDVDTRNGVVTLRGEVASDNERAQSLLLARTTAGVERVEDALIVNAALAPSPAGGLAAPAPSPEAPRPEDAALTARVESRLLADPQVKSGSIEVTAKDGVLLLEGTLPTTTAQRRAISLARGTEGVIQVIDRISVRRVR